MAPWKNFSCNWSSDSRWLTYSRDLPNYYSAAFLYDFQHRKLTQATSGFYNCSNPVFDSEGKYLFLFTNQGFRPLYSDIDNTFAYANSTKIAAISLKQNTPSILYPKNDKVEMKKAEDSATTATKKDDKKNQRLQNQRKRKSQQWKLI